MGVHLPHFHNCPQSNQTPLLEVETPKSEQVPILKEKKMEPLFPVIAMVITSWMTVG